VCSLTNVLLELTLTPLFRDVKIVSHLVQHVLIPLVLLVNQDSLILLQETVYLNALIQLTLIQLHVLNVTFLAKIVMDPTLINVSLVLTLEYSKGLNVSINAMMAISSIVHPENVNLVPLKP
jgi:hypothetical protein